MVRPSKAQCDFYVTNGVNATADADIAGAGVITAFLKSAYATFVLVLAAYMFGLLHDELLGPVDRRVSGIINRRNRYPVISAVIRKVVLTLSDQQIVTGIAVMGAAFQGLRTGQISVYHYQIALYLAWLSSSVHLSTLTLLRPYLERHPSVKLWRVVGVGVLLVLLVVGLVPTVSYDWGIVYPQDPFAIPDVLDFPTGWGIPAICFWGETYGDGVNHDTPIA